MSSFSEAIRNVFSVRASSPPAESVAGFVDEAAIPPPPAPSVADAVEYIPLPPAPPEAVAPVLNALGEPTFQSMGLGGWTPIGLIQSALETLHVTCDLPWWGTIAIATVILRTLIFPLVVVSQRNAAKMNNYMPQLQVLQMKMTEARNAGDQLNAARYSQEMVIFMKEKNLSPMRNILVPLAQAPIFISMFIGLRRMANLPVESLGQGGMWWFVDLTLPDAYYLLPIITSCTMLATIELGTDGARLSGQNMQYMKYVLRAMPLFIFPFTINFPAAVLCYWVSTNFFSLIQVGFLRIPAIREYFRIEKLVTHKKESLPQKDKKGPVEGFKESWRNMKISREIEDRQRYDEIRFKKAGTGPVVRTYKHDPTKKVINVQAKVKAK